MPTDLPEAESAIVEAKSMPEPRAAAIEGERADAAVRIGRSSIETPGLDFFSIN